MDRFRQLFSMVWIGLCATAMVEQSRLLLHLTVVPGWLEVFVFCGTLFGYHYAHPNKGLRLLALLMILPAAAAFMLAPLPTWVLAVPALGWLGYYGFEQSGKTGLRSGLWAKPITVALTWTWVTVVLPLYADTTEPFHWMFLERAFFIFALAMAYDLSDVAYDQAHGFGTLAATLGGKHTMYLIHGCLLVSGILACLQGYMPAHLIGLGVALLAGACWLQWILHQAKWHTWHKPMIDGVMVLVYLSVLLFGGLREVN